MFYKIKKTDLPKYLSNVIPKSNNQYNNRAIDDVATFYCISDIFKYSHFPLIIMNLNKLDVTIRRSESLPSFENYFFKFGRPTAKPT